MKALVIIALFVTGVATAQVKGIKGQVKGLELYQLDEDVLTTMGYSFQDSISWFGILSAEDNQIETKSVEAAWFEFQRLLKENGMSLDRDFDHMIPVGREDTNPHTLDGILAGFHKNGFYGFNVKKGNIQISIFVDDTEIVVNTHL